MSKSIKNRTPQEKARRRLKQKYTTALLQFQAYLLEKRLTGEATITRTALLKMTNYN